MRLTKGIKMPKIIKLKNKPKAPTRSNIKRSYHIYIGETLKSIIENVPENAEFTTKTDYYDGEKYLFTWGEEECEKSWNKELRKYNHELNEYNKWYANNIEDIEYTLKKREEAKAENKKIAAQLRKENLEKELEKLNKILT